MSIFDPHVAETVVDGILSSNDEILSISIIDMRGNILATKSKEYFREALGVSRNGDKYGVSLVAAVFGLIQLARNVTEEAKAVTTIHENCKLMLLPLPSFQVLVGLILQRSVNAEDYNIANKIERLMVDILWHI
ncbi:MAG: hypothetical protein M3298_01050 [Thermoproteota archaeon]|jgi:hypothetical protein|nr:hypothetical protein [Thermoproteota archaeon]MDQ3806733.1 hypothetical protein [Thermoproteota archaeon]